MRDEPPPTSGRLTREEIELDRRTVRKLDTVLLPFLAVLFLFNSLDKSNIGNAETAHFTSDIGIRPEDLNTAVGVFFAFFVALQPVGAALGRKYGMRRWVPICMSIWGLCTMLHVWVNSKWQLVLLRMIIGSLEAGFYPVSVSYLSLFYTKYEFARRLSVFYGQSALAGALGALLSFALFSRFPEHSTSKWKPWQVLFLLEGTITVLIAVIGFLWLPNTARDAWFLTLSERRWAEERINKDRDSAGQATPSKLDEEEVDRDDEDGPATSSEQREGLLSASLYPSTASSYHRKTTTSSQGLTRTDVLSAVLDWKIWYLLACNILSAIPVTAFSIFLPLVLAPMASPPGAPPAAPDTDISAPSPTPSNPALTNLLAAPPFLLSAGVLFTFARYSDRHHTRLNPILLGLTLIILGLSLVVLFHQTWIIPRYLCLCLIVSGSFVPSPLTVAWLSGNTPSPGKRAMLLGINGWGNLAGAFSAAMFHPEYAAGGYRVPLFHTWVCVVVAFAGFWAFEVLLVRENERREAVCRRIGIREVERERLYGTAKIHEVHAWSEALPWIGTVRRWVKQQRAGDGVEGRVGDERLTFRYGL